MKKLKEFIITIDEKTSQEIERTKYELDRECQNVSRLISKDLPFDGLAIKNHYDILAEKVAYYDQLKDQLSNDVVIPKAVEKWGPRAAVAWSLDFRTYNVTVTFTNSDNTTTYNNVIEFPQDFTGRMKYLSVNTKVCEEIADMINSTYPTIDTVSYKEFLAFKESLEKEYADKKSNVEREYIQPWIEENLESSPKKFNWRLIFDSSKITISVE